MSSSDIGLCCSSFVASGCLSGTCFIWHCAHCLNCAGVHYNHCHSLKLKVCLVQQERVYVLIIVCSLPKRSVLERYLHLCHMVQFPEMTFCLCNLIREFYKNEAHIDFMSGFLDFSCRFCHLTQHPFDW